MYLLFAEAWALSYNIWMINISIGSTWGDIPVEEALFYILVALLSVFGFELCDVFYRD